MRSTMRWVVGCFGVLSILAGIGFGVSLPESPHSLAGRPIADGTAAQGPRSLVFSTETSMAPDPVDGAEISPPKDSRGLNTQKPSTSAATDSESAVTESPATVPVPIVPQDATTRTAPSSSGSSEAPASPGTPQTLRSKGRATVAFIGDSYTNGTGASDHSKRWTDIVSAARNWNEVNLGAGGTGYVNIPSVPQQACGRSSCPTYVEQAQQAVQVDPQIVIISGGRNDLTEVAHEPDRVRDAVNRVLSTLRTGLPQARIIVIAPFWDSTTPSRRITELASWLRVAAIQYDADFIAGASQYLVGQPGAIWHDGVHPNDLGYAIIADRVDHALTRVLGSSSRAGRSHPNTGAATTSRAPPPTK